jgi:peptidoglycan/xylan/chitin deacetylase (PgdA/CDA1 family)
LQTLAGLTGKRPALFRSPYGEWSSAYSDACALLEMTPVWWDVDSLDWQQEEAGIIAERVLAQLDPGEIVLMHDGGGNRSQTVIALATILESLQAKDWAAVTVGELTRQ